MTLHIIRRNLRTRVLLTLPLVAPNGPGFVTMFQKPKELALEDGNRARMYYIEKYRLIRFRVTRPKKGAPKAPSEAGMLLKRKARRIPRIGTCDDVVETSGS